MFEVVGSKILIVDDDVATSSLLAELLSGEGHRTSLAHDGLDALLLVEQDPPDLILLDLDLPRASGYEVCRTLKSNPETHWIPIIMYRATGWKTVRAWLSGRIHSETFQLEVAARCRCSGKRFATAVLQRA